MQSHQQNARDQHLELRVEPAPPGPQVAVDAERLPRVFDNLISNALAHTPAGGTVTVRARRDAAFWRVEVQDTGPGIEPRHQTQVFEKFFRVPGQTRRGAGLGLFIAREVVRAHGGEIGVEGRPGSGAIFWFTLPVPSASTDA